MIIENVVVIEETDITADLGGHRYPVFNITFSVDREQSAYQIQTFSIKEAFRKAKEYGRCSPIYFKGLDYNLPKLVDDMLKLQLYLTFE